METTYKTFVATSLILIMLNSGGINYEIKKIKETLAPKKSPIPSYHHDNTKTINISRFY